MGWDVEASADRGSRSRFGGGRSFVPVSARRVGHNRAGLVKLAASLVLAVLLPCCASTYEPGAKFNYQDDVGFAKVSVISVTPWSTIETALAPNFQLTEAEALKRVANVARSEDEIIASTFTNQLNFSFTPGGAGSQTKGTTTKSDSSSETSDNGKSDSQGKQGAGSGAKSGGKSSDGSKQAESAPVFTTMPASAQYQLATALIQQVRLLNNYIK